jgi:hypothetical protein
VVDLDHDADPGSRRGHRVDARLEQRHHVVPFTFDAVDRR